METRWYKASNAGRFARDTISQVDDQFCTVNEPRQNNLTSKQMEHHVLEYDKEVMRRHGREMKNVL